MKHRKSLKQLLQEHSDKASVESLGQILAQTILELRFDQDEAVYRNSPVVDYARREAKCIAKALRDAKGDHELSDETYDQYERLSGTQIFRVELMADAIGFASHFDQQLEEAAVEIGRSFYAGVVQDPRLSAKGYEQGSITIHDEYACGLKAVIEMLEHKYHRSLE